MRLVIKKAAAKTLRRMQSKVATAIIAEMERIAAEPFDRHPQAKPLKGLAGMFRLRHGDWRAVYRIDRVAETVSLEDVRKREEAYR